MYKILYGVLLSCCALTGYAEPVAWQQPLGDWQTRSSAHFQIHYPQALEALAQKSLAIAEQVHADLVPFFTQMPSTPTHLVLVDDFDFSNGWATPLPYNQIRLFAHAPIAVDGLEQMDDWLHGLIRHEYVHIVHFNLARGVPRAGQRIFGRLPWFFPHLLTPSLFSEGLAVYLESNQALGYGRLTGSYLPMQMRAEVAANGGDGLDQVVLVLRDRPASKAYLYGAYFWQYLAATYGDDKIKQYLHEYSGQFLPYVRQNQTARRVFGKNFLELWQDFRVWLPQHFAALPTSVDVSSPLPTLASSQQVTATSIHGLWQVLANDQDRPMLGRWTLSPTPQFTPFSAVKNVVAMDVAEDGSVAVSRVIARADGSVSNDIFLWSESTGWQQLTDRGRYTQLRWRDNQQLVVSRQQQGVSELWQLKRTGQAQLLWRGDDTQVLGSFDVSAEGTYLVASMKRANQGWNLERFDLIQRHWQPLTATKAIEHQPQLLMDGTILYSADYAGVFNIYQLDPDSREVTQLTAVATGALQPQLQGETLVYQQYGSTGFTLRYLTPTPLRQFNLAEQVGSYDYPPLNQPAITQEARPYRPWSTLWPTAWMPESYRDEITQAFGFSVSGQDALNRHQYEFSLNYNAEYALTAGRLNYFYDNRWQWAAVHDHNFYAVGPNQYAIRAQTKTLLARHHLWDGLEDQLQLHLGLSHERYRFETVPLAVRVTGADRTDSLVGTALTFDNREYYRQVPSVGYGSYARLTYESYEVIANDTAGQRLQLGLQHSFDLPGRSTLRFAVDAGTSTRGTPFYVLGGSQVRDDAQLFGRSELSLPGYVAGALSGEHFYRSELRYRAWLARVERNLGLWPLGLGDLSASAWLGSASAWTSGAVSAANALGIEVQADVVLGYQLVVPLTLGVARGLHEGLGQTQAYVQLGLAF